jgi:hypothetical protein
VSFGLPSIRRAKWQKVAKFHPKFASWRKCSQTSKSVFRIELWARRGGRDCERKGSTTRPPPALTFNAMTSLSPHGNRFTSFPISLVGSTLSSRSRRDPTHFKPCETASLQL